MSPGTPVVSSAEQGRAGRLTDFPGQVDLDAFEQGAEMSPAAAAWDGRDPDGTRHRLWFLPTDRPYAHGNERRVPGGRASRRSSRSIPRRDGSRTDREPASAGRRRATTARWRRLSFARTRADLIREGTRRGIGTGRVSSFIGEGPESG